MTLPSEHVSRDTASLDPNGSIADALTRLVDGAIAPATNADGDAAACAELALHVDCAEVVNYARVQSGIPIIPRLLIANGGTVSASDLVLRAELRCAAFDTIAASQEWAIREVPAGERVGFVDLTLAPDPAVLLALEESVPGELHAEVRRGDVVLAREQWPTRILAHNEFWSSEGMQELVAAHVLPNHPAITPILQAAGQILGARTGDTSLQGYQGGTERAVQIAEAVYEALREHGIGYIDPPASFERTGQKIRTPAQVIDDRLGTCLDLACTYAACLEQAGLHPAIYLIQGHAYAGLFTAEDFGSTTASLAAQDMVVSAEDARVLVPVEAVGFTSGANEPFASAVQRARARLHEPGVLQALVDVRRARGDGVLPLPYRTVQDGAVTIVVHEAPAPAAPAARGPTPVRPREARREREERTPARIRRWKSDLLDLSLRNPLLHLSSRRVGLELLPAEGSLDLLEDLLAAGEAISLVAADALTALHRARGARSAADVEAPLRHEMLDTARHLYVDCEEDRLRGRLRTLMQKARTAEEESGTNILHVSLGSLHWKDPKTRRDVRSPVLLVPVRLRPAGRGKPPELVMDPTGSTTHNYCLLQKLKLTFDLDVPELERLESDDAGVAVGAALDGLRRAIVAQRLDMRVDDDAVLGLFQFGKFRMWKDLDDHWERFVANPVVRHLVETPGESFVGAVPLPDPASLDAREVFCPIPCDGAQLQAVVAAGAGGSYVLEGPPGTGKSQTITNIIANALAAGRKVLFVAEKRAALDVVKRRLEAAGLGPFCLDIHGKNSSAQQLREQLLASLEAQFGADLDGWQRGRSELAERSARLRRYAEALHDPAALGLSAWTARQALLELGEGAEVAIPPASLGPVASAMHALQPLLAELPQAAADAQWRGRHAWSLCAESRFERLDRANLARAVAAIRDTLAALERTALPGSGDVLARAGSLAQLRAAVAVSAGIAAGFGITRAGVWAAAEPEWRRRHAAALAHLQRFRKTVAPLLERFDVRFLGAELEPLLTDARLAADSFFLFRRGRLRAVRARLAPYLRSGQRIELSEVVALIERALQASREAAEVAREARRIPGIGLPDEWTPLQPDAESVLQGCADALLGGAVLLGIDDAAALEGWFGAPREAHAAAGGVLRELAAAWDALLGALGTVEGQLEAWTRGAPLLAAARVEVEQWHADAQDARFIALMRWCKLRGRLDAIAEAGLPEVRTEVIAGRLDPADAVRAVARGVARGALQAQLARPELDAFDALEHNRIVERMTVLRDADSVQLRTVVPAKLLETRPFRPGQRFGEVGELARRELTRQRGGSSIRTLLRTYARATIQLTPCLLMSPDSVAQFLEPGAIEFDLVVFDEASQVPVSNAIGSIGRGKALVIVGDSRQMPPTAFFAAGSEDDDALAPASLAADAAAEDLESILSECVGSGLPRLWLSWHYRSQDESLIAFSNAHYYEGRLASFPTPLARSPRLGVRWHRVSDGVFDRGDTRTNRREAETIADLIQARLREADGEVPGIGVVTLNLEQCELLSEILEERAASDARLDAALRHEEPDRRLFVKNLENVQGDERDIIYLSVGFGFDAAGQMTMNFGPLNRMGGERRWNVAITRARQQVVIVSSIDPEAIDLSRVGVGAKGVRHLRAYLEMARDGHASAGNLAAASGRSADHHREEIARALRAAGLHVESDVGLSGFKVDLALALPEAPDERLVAVLLDGPGYAARHTVHDRDGMPATVLCKLMGWPRTLRIWLPEWLAERERVIADSVAAVREAQRVSRERGARVDDRGGETGRHEVAEGIGAVPDDQMPTYRAMPVGGAAVSAPPFASAPPRDPEDEDFREYVSPFDLGTREDLDVDGSHRARARVAAALREVIEVEAPVEARRLARLVARRFGLQRVREDRVQEILACLPAGHLVRSSLGDFAWRQTSDAATWRGFRRAPGGADRTPDEVAPEEIRNAMVYFARRGVSIAEEELIAELAEVLGVRRVTVAFRERMQGVLGWAVRRGELRLERGRVVAG